MWGLSFQSEFTHIVSPITHPHHIMEIRKNEESLYGQNRYDFEFQPNNVNATPANVTNEDVEGTAEEPVVEEPVIEVVAEEVATTVEEVVEEKAIPTVFFFQEQERAAELPLDFIGEEDEQDKD